MALAEQYQEAIKNAVRKWHAGERDKELQSFPAFSIVLGDDEDDPGVHIELTNATLLEDVKAVARELSISGKFTEKPTLGNLALVISFMPRKLK